jgi:altronate dehydratase large subunit
MTGPTFQGYARRNGPSGIRNHLLVLAVCGLNASGARKTANRLPNSKLVISPYGRGQVGEDKIFHQEMLSGLACHPNVGGVVILAPDDGLRDFYAEVVDKSGRACCALSLQECHEDGELIVQRAVAEGKNIQSELDATPRQSFASSQLIVAAECGHSDASSGILTNPLVGAYADRLTAQSGRFVISETLEWTGTEKSLMKRCATPQIAATLEALYSSRQRIAETAGIDVQLGNPGPQNHEGGLTTLVEKSLGAVMKGGSGPIVGVLEQGREIPRDPGLYLMDSPTLSPESISSMVAGGAQMVLFTTGHGNPYGSALAPTIKITANPETATRLPRQIDFDASSAFTGSVTASELLQPLEDLTLKVASGETTWSEKLDEGEEVISRKLPSI